MEPSNASGFYFDPDTTLAAEAVPETFETALFAIKQDPAYYAQFPNPFFITPFTEQIRPQ